MHVTKQGSNNNNKVCLYFLVSRFSCRRSLWCTRIKVMQYLAWLLEGQRRSSWEQRRTAEHSASQEEEEEEVAPSLGLEAVSGKRAAPNHVCDVCLPKLLHRRNLHFLWCMVLYAVLNGNLEVSNRAYPSDVVLSTFKTFISSWAGIFLNFSLRKPFSQYFLDTLDFSF